VAKLPNFRIFKLNPQGTMLEPVLYIGITQTLFAGLIISTKRPQIQADRYLAAWLFIISIEMILAMVKVRYLQDLPYQVPFLVLPFIYGPLLFLYVRSLILEKPAFKWVDLLHFLPFVVLFGIAFLFKDAGANDDPYEAFPAENPGWFARSIYNILIFISLTVYSTLAFILLDRHRRKLKHHFSYRSGKITLNWLLFVSITLYVSYCLAFLTSGFALFQIDLPFDPIIFTYVGLAFFSFAFSFYGYKQAGIYHIPISSYLRTQKPEEEKGKAYSKSGLTPAELNSLLQKIVKEMELSKIYLDPELSLDKVSQKFKLPKHHITQALNTQLNKNFFTFVNEYRINEFKERLEEEPLDRLTILGLAYECGFNSKSTFNSVFKKLMNQTPTEFLRARNKTK